MVTEYIRLLVDIEIHEGKFAEFEAIVKQMAAVSKTEPGTMGYHFLLSPDRQHCRLVEGYKDAAAITAHFNGPAVTQLGPRMIEVSSPICMESMAIPVRTSLQLLLPGVRPSLLRGRDSTASTGPPFACYRRLYSITPHLNIS
jgi:quinol monooxygenase YgiN